MKRVWICLLLMLCMAAGACAQEISVFVSGETMEESAARQMINLLATQFPEAEWVLEMEKEQTLREKVLADCSPHLAVCRAGEALPWAKEGLLIPLTGVVSGQKQIQEQVIACCEYGERLFMAPLFAQHRRIAVNRGWFESKQLGYMLSGIEYPVWYLTQLHQIMEEFALSGVPAFEIWPAESGGGAALEAFVQGLYGGMVLAADGSLHADLPEIEAGLKWLGGMVHSGMIECAESREEALKRFISGQIPMFADWTEETERACAEQIEENNLELTLMPYPSASGEMVRSFDLTGAVVFAREDERENDLAVRAVAFLHEDVQMKAILHGRAIGRDDAVWIADLSDVDGGATLRTLFAGVIDAVVFHGADAAGELAVLQAMLDAAR